MRITLFGGGTDYPEFYNRHGGETISVTINKFTYVVLRKLHEIDAFNYRIIYSNSELCNNILDIKQPIVKAVLQRLLPLNRLEIHYLADLPTNCGLGTSSSFCVGLINAINYLKNGVQLNPLMLAEEAIHVERNILCENVGVQDQYSVAMGGLVHLKMHTTGSISANKLLTSYNNRLTELSKYLIIFYTGKQRFASEVLTDQIQRTKSGRNDNLLLEILDITREAVDIIKNDNRDIYSIGKLFDNAWKIKRSLSNSVSNEEIDAIYSIGIANGAVGGKLIGAGGSGFMMFFAHPSFHEKITSSLHYLKKLNFRFEFAGSQVIEFGERYE